MINYTAQKWNTVAPYNLFTPSRMNHIDDGIVAACNGVDALSGDISTEFSPTLPYTVGMFCMYGTKLYRFVSAKAAGAWDATKVEPVKLDTLITEINSNLAGKVKSAAGTILNLRMTSFSMTFTSGIATASMASLKEGKSLATIVVATAENTSTVSITGSTIVNDILTIKAYQGGSGAYAGTITVNVIYFLIN